jgi:hypothetical protein
VAAEAGAGRPCSRSAPRGRAGTPAAASCCPRCSRSRRSGSGCCPAAATPSRR